MIHTNSSQLLKDISEETGKFVRLTKTILPVARKQSLIINTQVNYYQSDRESISSLETHRRQQQQQLTRNQHQQQQQQQPGMSQMMEPTRSNANTPTNTNDTLISNNNSNSNNYNYNSNRQHHDQNQSQTTTTSHQNNQSNHNSNDEIRSVIVTGCGSKIGRKIATAFAKLDFNIALVDFDTKQTQSVAQECQESSGKNRQPLEIIADISQLDEAHKVIDKAVKQFGRLDVLVNTINNAALMEAHFTSGEADDDPHVFEQYHRIIANNMHSVTYLCISAAPHLRRSKGSIVNVSSISENEHGSYKFAYCMSKAGIWTLTKCLATDYAPDINIICVTDQPNSDSKLHNIPIHTIKPPPPNEPQNNKLCNS